MKSSPKINKSKYLAVKLTLLVLAIIAMTPLILSGAESIPLEISSLKSKRETAITANKQKCDQELEKLKVSYSKQGILEVANLIVYLQTKKRSFLPQPEMPLDVMKVESQRAETTARINLIYEQELNKLKTNYTKAGDLKSANLIVMMMLDVPTELALFYGGPWFFTPAAGDAVSFSIEENCKVSVAGGKEGSWKTVSDGKIRVTYASGKWCEIMRNDSDVFVTNTSNGKLGKIVHRGAGGKR